MWHNMAWNKRKKLDYTEASAIFFDMMDGEFLSDEEDSDLEV